MSDRKHVHGLCKFTFFYRCNIENTVLYKREIYLANFKYT